MAKRKKKDEHIDGSKKPKVDQEAIPKPAPESAITKVPLEVGKNVGNKSKVGVHGLKIVFQEGLLREGIQCQIDKGQDPDEVIVQIDNLRLTYTLDNFKERLGF